MQSWDVRGQGLCSAMPGWGDARSASLLGLGCSGNSPLTCSPLPFPEGRTRIWKVPLRYFVLRSLDFYPASALTRYLCKYLHEDSGVSEGTGWTLRSPVVPGRQPRASRSHCLPGSGGAPLLSPSPSPCSFCIISGVLQSARPGAWADFGRSRSIHGLGSKR